MCYISKWFKLKWKVSVKLHEIILQIRTQRLKTNFYVSINWYSDCCVANYKLDMVAVGNYT